MDYFNADRRRRGAARRRRRCAALPPPRPGRTPGDGSHRRRALRGAPHLRLGDSVLDGAAEEAPRAITLEVPGRELAGWALHRRRPPRGDPLGRRPRRLPLAELGPPVRGTSSSAPPAPMPTLVALRLAAPARDIPHLGARPRGRDPRLRQRRPCRRRRRGRQRRADAAGGPRLHQGRLRAHRGRGERGRRRPRLDHGGSALPRLPGDLPWRRAAAAAARRGSSDERHLVPAGRGAARPPHPRRRRRGRALAARRQAGALAGERQAAAVNTGFDPSSRSATSVTPCCCARCGISRSRGTGWSSCSAASPR